MVERRLFFILTTVVCIGVNASSPVWPEPVHWSKLSDDVLQINPLELRFEYHEGGEASASPPKTLEAAFDRYKSLFFPHAVDVSNGMGLHVLVSVENGSTPLELGCNESYALAVGSDATVELRAPSAWGALRGLETLSQLIDFDFDEETYTLGDYEIDDYPRFSHRGLLIDSGRHFEPIRALEGLVESMSYAKLNVLHWHLTEDQSFPMPSRVYPELQREGAWSKHEKYTAAEVHSFVEFARLRGVRVIPEFDMPGHTSSWRLSHPEIFASGCSADTRGAFDPANEQTWQLLTQQFTDWTTLFSDAFLHLGSDEVPSACWNNSDDLAWMSVNNLTNFDQVFSYFVDRAVGLVAPPKTVVLWDEAFSSAQPDKALVVIQNWHSDDLLAKIVAKGYRALASSSTYWYLDHLETQWDTMYAYEPLTGIPANESNLIIGGEGCMYVVFCHIE